MLARTWTGERENEGKDRMQTLGNKRKYCFEVFAGTLEDGALDGKENMKQLSFRILFRDEI